MKFLLDECATSRPLQSVLTDLGCDFFSVRDRLPHASDEAALAFAFKENRVLITEDKDFGELVFLRGLPHPSIVRFIDMTPSERADVMPSLLKHHAEAMLDGAIIVVTKERVRVRRVQNIDWEND